jgi:L-aminopeptidase/D-esterase-like protein
MGWALPAGKYRPAVTAPSLYMRRREFNSNLAILAATAAITTAATPESSDSGAITQVQGIKVGHFTDTRRPTGCTVLLFDKGAIAGVDVRGSAPGTRETDLLNPINTVQQIQSIVLSGGSAYGLEAAGGVMRYLEEKGLGYHLGPAVVPVVPAAILFDLGVGDPKIRPTAESGYQACQAAATGKLLEGNVGAGAGATIGKLFGAKLAMKSGLGTASLHIEGTDVVVGAIVAVNAVGDVVDPGAGAIIAGARKPDGSGFLDCMSRLRAGVGVVLPSASRAQSGDEYSRNTTIGVVATNVALGKAQLTKIAQMAHDGLARTIRPVHTLFDGDTLFAVATAASPTRVDHGAIGALAADVLEQAVMRAVKTATGLPGLPSYRDLNSH